MTFGLILLPFLLQSPTLPELLRAIDDSGRVLTLTQTLDEGLRIAPGAPPLLAFRYLEGQDKGHYKGLDLVLDDAGH